MQAVWVFGDGGDEGVKLTLPVPPSANAYWKLDRRGFIRVSDEARAYKANVQRRALVEGLRNPPGCPVVVTMTVYRAQRRGDLDNFQKVLLDALKGIAFLDDSQVVEIHSRREDDKANPRVEVEVSELPQCRI